MEAYKARDKAGIVHVPEYNIVPGLPIGLRGDRAA